MLLRSAPASPFARKIRMAVIHASLADKVTIVQTDTSAPEAAFLKDNPLGKIPTLVLPSGEALYDSRVIAAFLDDLAGGGVLVPRGPERITALKLEALADGVLDAVILQVYERRWRAQDQRSAAWVEHQAAKVARGLDEAERIVASETAGVPMLHIGHISLSCLLGYLDLRFDGLWRGKHSGLVAWLDAFAASCPAFERTRFKPPTGKAQ